MTVLASDARFFASFKRGQVIVVRVLGSVAIGRTDSVAAMLSVELFSVLRTILCVDVERLL